MRIESLQVKNVRGLVDFHFEPKGQNVVVCGPNGSGKSALVDAIDFLFTGRITRLQGKGTGELSLQTHGPHIGHKPDEAIVSAEISLSSNKRFKIERRMSQPKKLSCIPQADTEMEAVLKISERGYHVLSRREILKYVAAEPGTRAQEVQALLNLEEIEELRKLLISAEREFEKEVRLRVKDITLFETDLAKTMGLSLFTLVAVEAAVNAQRALLGGTAITPGMFGSTKTAIESPGAVTSPSTNPVLIAGDMEQIQFDKDTCQAPCDQGVSGVAQAITDDAVPRAVQL